MYTNERDVNDLIQPKIMEKMQLITAVWFGEKCKSPRAVIATCSSVNRNQFHIPVVCTIG